MKEFDVWRLARLYDFIDRADEWVRLYVPRREANANELISDQFKETFGIDGILILAQIIAKETHLEGTMARVFEGGGPFWMRVKTGITYQELVHQFEVLKETIEADLQTRLFYFVPPKDAERLSLDGWENVFDKLPDSQIDIQESTFCFAFGRYTASIFHSMRVAEHGLRFLAKKTRTLSHLKHKSKRQPIELADWQLIITAITNKIGKIRSNARTSLATTKKLELYSDASDHCTYMKDVWRNATSHARKPYDRTAAKNCLDRVHSFMSFLATEFGN